MKVAAASAAILCLVACQRPPEPSGFSVAARPERRDVIHAVMASHDVPLTVSPSCANVGTQPGDKTIGAYLSGFLSALDSPNGKNWLETRVSDAKDGSGSPVWRCELTIRHSAGEDEWGWGVRFDIAQSDRRVRPDSFTCIGGG